MSTGALIQCQKCGKSMEEGQFYTYKNGEKTELCKKCLTMHIDNFDPSTYLWLLEKMDVPYVPSEWNTLRDAAFAKNPKKMNGMSVFGKYLSKMRLKQWKDYGWSDSEQLQKEVEARTEKKMAQSEEERENIKQQFANGEITEAQYRTLMSTQSQYQEEIEKVARESEIAAAVGAANPFNEQYFIDQSELPDPAAELTKEDKIYLAMKWGREYTPNEWIDMEKKFNEMCESFDIQDSDTEGNLILICKTFLKMNEAINQNDMEGYQKLSKVYDALRKSSKFTAAQNKEQKDDFLDSAGELVAYCEKEGGRIPKYEITTPLDIVDKVIFDLKEYNKQLFYSDASLARQIEEYLKIRQSMEEKKIDKMKAQANGQSDIELDDEDIMDYREEMRKQREQDAQDYEDEGDENE